MRVGHALACAATLAAGAWLMRRRRRRKQQLVTAAANMRPELHADLLHKESVLLREAIRDDELWCRLQGVERGGD